MNKITSFFISIFYYVGNGFLSSLSIIGGKVFFIFLGIVHFFMPPIYFRAMWRHFVEIAFFSIPVVGLTSLFSGMVLVLQSYVGFARFSAEGAIANVVVVALTRELGPVLTALMVAGRISGSIAAEIGTMRVTEQVDALYTMYVNPIKYLISPKIIAGILALPVLVLLSDIIGVMGGYLISVFQLGFISSVYLSSTWSFVTMGDILSGIVKGAFFGLIITGIGCYYGYTSKGGSKGVGKSTTNAVVVAYILIFIVDYILTLIFFKS